MKRLSVRLTPCRLPQILLCHLDVLHSSPGIASLIFFRFSVPLDCRDAMELMVAAIVGSTDLEYHAKVPTTSCIRLMRAWDMAGEVSFSSICIFEPYWIGTAFVGACCGRLGLACWYLCRALGTKFGMWESRVRLS